MQITRHFNLSEFIKSDTAEKHNIDNTPSEEIIENITFLCSKLLQPLRSIYGKPMKINSGYRCKELNDIIKGSSKTSDHMKGLSADIACENPKELLQLLKSSKLDFDQAILYKHMIHLSRKYSGNRQQVIYKYE